MSRGERALEECPGAGGRRGVPTGSMPGEGFHGGGRSPGSRVGRTESGSRRGVLLRGVGSAVVLGTSGNGGGTGAAGESGRGGGGEEGAVGDVGGGERRWGRVCNRLTWNGGQIDPNSFRGPEIMDGLLQSTGIVGRVVQEED